MNQSKQKRLSKEEITNKIAGDAKIEHIKDVVRIAFPCIEKMDSVYDAQTAVNALGGFLASEVEKEAAKIKVSSISIDLSKEPDSKIKKAILNMVKLFPDESAQELAETMERLGTTLQAYVANTAMKGKMNIKITDLVSK